MNKPKNESSADEGISLVDLVHTANAGDKKALSVLKQALTGEHAIALMDIAGNLAGKLEESTLTAMLGDEQAGTRLILLKKLNEMRAEIGWNAASKLERSLIERVCQTWLYLHWLELSDAQSKNRPIEMVNSEANRIERAERRHLQAVKVLATVRKMALPLRIELKADLNVSEPNSPYRPRNRFELTRSAN